MDPYVPLPMGPASPTANVPALFTPNQGLAAAALGGPIGASVVVGLNYRAAGKSREAMLSVTTGVGIVVVLIALMSWLPDAATRGGAIGVIVATRGMLKQLNPTLVKGLGATGDAPPGSWGAAIGIGAVGLVASLTAGGLFAAFGPDVLLRQVTLASGDIVEFREGATADDARAAGEALTRMGVLGEGGGTVRIEHVADGYGLGFFVGPSDVDASEVPSLRAVAEQLGADAFGGKETRLRTCDLILDRCRDWP